MLVRNVLAASTSFGSAARAGLTGRTSAATAALKRRNRFELDKIRIMEPTSLSHRAVTSRGGRTSAQQPAGRPARGIFQGRTAGGDAGDGRDLSTEIPRPQSTAHPLTAAGRPTRIGVLPPQFLSPPLSTNDSLGKHFPLPEANRR